MAHTSFSAKFPPPKPKNIDRRTREYLTPAEVTQLMQAGDSSQFPGLTGGQMLGENVAARALADRLTVVPGEAPDVLDSLPDPDAVFVGGSRGRLTDILDVCQQRLRPGGR